MTSPREAVSILTAAALVVAPVGGVAATYTTGYAEDGAPFAAPRKLKFCTR